MAAHGVSLDTPLLPTRFQLSEVQLATALSLVGLRPSKLSPLPQLSPSPPPVAVLHGTRVLADDGQRLTPDAEAALHIVVAPGHLLSIVLNRAGQADWREVLFFAGTGAGPHVAVAKTNTQFDLALLPLEAQATVLIDDLFGFTALPAAPGHKLVALDLTGYAAILAAADLVQAARLQERTSRGEIQPAPVITPQSLQAQLEQGLQRQDTRWAVTAARKVCPVDLAAAVGKMAEGITVLVRAGLAVTSAGGHSLTPAGYRLASALGQIVTTGGTALSVARGDVPFTIAHFTVFRTTLAIWIAAWRQVSTSTAAVDMLEVSAAAALQLVGSLLDAKSLPELPQELRGPQCLACGAPLPDPAMKLCGKCATPPTQEPPVSLCANPACGKPLREGAKFCSHCGWVVSIGGPSAAPAERVCPMCQRVVPAGKKFCAFDGTHVP